MGFRKGPTEKRTPVERNTMTAKAMVTHHP
jgi:hypothetical protein